MIKLIAPATVALHAITLAAGVAWAYASHKYDCFNIGPCIGSVDFWINLGSVACYTFIASWLGLLLLTGLAGSRPARRAVGAWVVALVAPPATFLLASAAFNMGISATGG
jgi:hypothetical protein